MTNSKISKINNRLAALSMDLKRAAIGLHNNSPMAQKFIEESKLRISKLDLSGDKKYIKKIIRKIDYSSPDNLIMASQLIQNSITA